DGLLPRLLQRMEVNTNSIVRSLESELEKRPKVGGPGAEPGKVYVTQRINQILAKAESEASRLKDEYISVEHIALAMLDESGTPSARILKEAEINRDRFLKALTDVRGNQRVTSADPEATYEALERYGRDLVDLARRN